MIRDLGFISWKQESAWMESMKGVRWENMVERENKLFLSKLNVSKDDLLAKSEEFRVAKKVIHFVYENIIINYINGENIEWYYEDDSSKKYSAANVFKYKNYVYQIRDLGKGSKNYVLECLNKHKVVWKKENVGSYIFVNDDICYYLGSKNIHWYNKLYCANYSSGKEETILYEEKDVRFELSLVKGDNNCLFLIRENSGKQNLFVISKSKIIYKNDVLQY